MSLNRINFKKVEHIKMTYSIKIGVLISYNLLTLTTMKYFIYNINHGRPKVFSILNLHQYLSQLFLLHLNTNVMGLWPL